MLRRSVISTLWFVAAVVVYELVWSLTGSPRPLGIAVGVLAGAFAWVDPFHQFHSASATGAATAAQRRPNEASLATN